MKLRWHPAGSERDVASRPNDDGGGEGAEYVDGALGGSDREDVAADHAAWYRARHWTPDRHPSDAE
jgi:hypothetical protein